MYDSSSTLDQPYGSGPSLTVADSANLRKAGKWARFIAIFTMAFLGIVLLFLVLGGAGMLAYMGFNDAGPVGLIVLLVYGLVLAFAFYMMYLQYQFGNSAMQAVDRNDSAAMSQSLAALGRYYKIYGLIMAIYVAFLGIGLLFGVLGGALTFFS